MDVSISIPASLVTGVPGWSGSYDLSLMNWSSSSIDFRLCGLLSPASSSSSSSSSSDETSSGGSSAVGEAGTVPRCIALYSVSPLPYSFDSRRASLTGSHGFFWVEVTIKSPTSFSAASAVLPGSS